MLPRHAHGDGLAGDGALQQGLIVGAEDAVGFDGWGWVLVWMWIDKSEGGCFFGFFFSLFYFH